MIAMPRSGSVASVDALENVCNTVPANHCLYRVAEVIRTPAGRSKELVYVPRTRTVCIAPADILRTLCLSRKFASIEEHGQRCVHMLPGKYTVEQVVLLLRELLLHGVFISTTEVDAWLMQTSEQPRATVSSIGFVTRDRPDGLCVTVRSHIENSETFDRHPDVFVLDDSQDPAVRDTTRAMLRSVQQRHRVSISYAGAEEKHRFAEALASATGVPLHVVSFALFGDPGFGRVCGANRNCFLLHTVGDMSLSVDDDVLCQITGPPEPNNGITFSSEYDPCEYWFYPHRSSAVRSAKFVSRNVASLHEHLLGKTLSECAAESTRDGLDHINDGCLFSMACGSGRVRITVAGLLGDCGMSFPRWFGLTGASKERLTRTPRDYASAFTSREVLRIARQATVTSGTFCMASCIGLDNREQLPPFFPVGRNQDGLFGLTVRMLSSEAYIAHLPWALLHQPPEKRRYPHDALREDGSGIEMCDIVMKCLGSCQVGGMGLIHFRCLGQHLLSLSNLEPVAFREFLRLALVRDISRSTAYFEHRLHTEGECPDWWAADLRRYIDIRREAVTREQYIVPRELRGYASAETALCYAQALIGKYGQLLIHWSDIVEGTRRLREGGIRLAVQL